MNPNTGALIDGSDSPGINPDNAINGYTEGVGAAAYSNNRPNTSNGTILYTIDPGTDALYLQTPPGSGFELIVNVVTLDGVAVDLRRASLDIAPMDIVDDLGGPLDGLMVARIGEETALYRLNLRTAVATRLQSVPFPVRSAAVRTLLSTAIVLDTEFGSVLVPFDPTSPSTSVPPGPSTGVGTLAPGETLAALDIRPQTGQLYGLGINPASNSATAYIIDPKNSESIAVGTPGNIHFVDGSGNAVILLDGSFGYGMDFDPTRDQLRVVTGDGGLNFRVNPNTGTPIDGDFGSEVPIPGINPDGNLNGAAEGAFAIAYADSFGQPLDEPGGSTLYSLPRSDPPCLAIQSPENSGTLTAIHPLSLDGEPFSFDWTLAFDIVATSPVVGSIPAARNDGWVVTRSPSLARLFRLDLTTGKAISVGKVGDGLVIPSGLAVWSAPIRLADDATFVTAIDGQIRPLANDEISGNVVISKVSDEAIIVNGRTLTIPAGYSGKFDYIASNGWVTGQATVTVTAADSIQSNHYVGLLNTFGAVSGFASVAVSPTGKASIKLRIAAETLTAKISIPEGSDSGTLSTRLGTLTLVRNSNGSATVTLGTETVGVLRPTPLNATPAIYNIALASIDPALPGGGYAVARVSKTGAVRITGIVPDGLPFSASTWVADDRSIAFHSTIKKRSKPAGFVAGELTPANLFSTDITGELRWLKPRQSTGAKGLHLSGVDSTLTANGNLHDSTISLFGDGHLSLTGGNLAESLVDPVTINQKGIPLVPVGILKRWSGVSAKQGRFSATLLPPSSTKSVGGSGIYLNKSRRAWGFFPGTTEGGRIELDAASQSN
jgi:hypothetical protein